VSVVLGGTQIIDVLKNSGTLNSFRFLSNNDVTTNYALADQNRCLIQSYDIFHLNNSAVQTGDLLYEKLELELRGSAGDYEYDGVSLDTFYRMNYTR
jgi:hypothetical protein